MKSILKSVSPEVAVPLGFFGMPLVLHLLTQNTRKTCDAEMNPECLLQELTSGEADIRASPDIAKEVLSLQDWRKQMMPRLRLLEQSLAWKVLGISETDDMSAVGKAFKRRALELHPDKGGDEKQFQLLQDMKGLLMPEGPSRQSLDSRDSDTDEDIEDLIHARRREDAFKGFDVYEESLSETRMKLHQAVRLSWARFQSLKEKLTAHEKSEDKASSNGSSSLAVDKLNGFLRERGKATLEGLLEGVEVVGAAALVDPSATIVAIQTYSNSEDLEDASCCALLLGRTAPLRSFGIFGDAFTIFHALCPNPKQVNALP